MKKMEQLELLSMINSTLTEQNLDVAIVKKIVELRRKINKFRAPIFKENGVPVMKHWDEFRPIGLLNCDYVTTEFYKTGFTEE